MMGALIRKDLSLLRLYLRGLVGALIACFTVAAIAIYVDAREAVQSFVDSRTVIASILAGGSLLGLIVVSIFSALLSGSIITLERSDRSSQFLACLPPMRFQNYLSKLIVVASTVLLSLGICLLAWFVAYQLNHSGETPLGSSELPKKLKEIQSPALFVRVFLRFADSWSDATVYPLFALLASIVGGSLLTSLGSRSNAIPALGGILTPIMLWLAFLSTTWLLNFRWSQEAFNLFFLVAAGFGLCCIVASGCIYRVQREF
jgi:hypothetical protein